VAGHTLGKKRDVSLSAGRTTSNCPEKTDPKGNTQKKKGAGCDHKRTTRVRKKETSKNKKKQQGTPRKGGDNKAEFMGKHEKKEPGGGATHEPVRNCWLFSGGASKTEKQSKTGW